MPRRMSDIEKEKKKVGKTIYQHSKKFYQTPEWRNIREEYREKKRQEHERILMDVYQQNMDKNSPDALIEFIFDERQNPLSELSLKRGIIKVADVCDHIRDRRLGGSDKQSNLQWLTFKEHKIKTLRERNREK